MKNFIAPVLVVALVSAAVAGGSAKSQIEADNIKVAKFMKAQDVAGFKKFMSTRVTKNFKYTEGTNSMNFQQMCDNMKEGLTMMSKITSVTNRILSIKETGKTAKARVLHSMVGVQKGADKKTHTMGFSGESDETYVLEGATWKMASMTWDMTKQKMTMDGKPMNMGAPTGGK